MYPVIFKFNRMRLVFIKQRPEQFSQIFVVDFIKSGIGLDVFYIAHKNNHFAFEINNQQQNSLENILLGRSSQNDSGTKVSFCCSRYLIFSSCFTISFTNMSPFVVKSLSFIEIAIYL